ncbi:putative SWI/SNF-related matrix-associated actin-dependent regulator of chromatin subfamily A-like protein 1 [Cocos nucifera]|uniref:Putative SWI/SNF-related matrix-associated actin-dependent regulator of chromatin subfamily A-like protein 1 n=1 Tax=Cocos nucifera TaxID=13894 RepID=A0A8K0I9D1_COCNU|nr:putative SWI/SNF-related matrix-associated actin-dependent regulator of chromatin subfamily A-like protein 1 [Cocos nucifera]
MASAKGERPLEGSQVPLEKAKKESPPAKTSAGAHKSQARKLGPKKAEQKPREPKKKTKGGKSAAKK